MLAKLPSLSGVKGARSNLWLLWSETKCSPTCGPCWLVHEANGNHTYSVHNKRFLNSPKHPTRGQYVPLSKHNYLRSHNHFFFKTVKYFHSDQDKPRNGASGNSDQERLLMDGVANDDDEEEIFTAKRMHVTKL